MGSMFRSEEMALCQLFTQHEAAYTSVSELGESGTVQFRDLNPKVSAFHRKFVNEVRRCDELERKLRYIEAEVKKDNLTIPRVKKSPRAPKPWEIIDFEARLEKTENEIRVLSRNASNLKFNFVGLTELKHVLEKTHVFFTEPGPDGMDYLNRIFIHEYARHIGATRGRLDFLAGVIQRKRVPAFEKMLWRVSRGNIFLRQAPLDKPLEDPTTGDQIDKTVCVAFFQGEELKARIQKVFVGFHASLYPCPSSHNERQDMIKEICIRLHDLYLVLNQTHDHLQQVLMSVAMELTGWTIMVRKIKAIYHTLNLFNMDVTKKCLIGECWVPVVDLPSAQKALADGSISSETSIPSFLNPIETSENPPTFNHTNIFTQGFQNLIDAYGVASYREVNPALYTIITFPFLFSIMFGDCGHGLIMFIFAAYMCRYEESLAAKKINNEIWNIFFGGRYIILIMGIFSIYTGLIYNDVFSKSLNIFGSNWRSNISDSDTLIKHKAIQFGPNETYLDYPYPFGMDPIWQLAENKIIFINSYKMKLSIIIGVIHMIFGVCMSTVNYSFFKHPSSILVEFLPQLLFLVLLFFYMVAMIFIKWTMYSDFCNYDLTLKPGCAPSVLIIFINMILLSGTKAKDKNCDAYMFKGQQQMQFFFVLVAVLCIPIMLLGKPLIIKFSSKSKKPESSNRDVNQGLEMTPEAVEAPSSDEHHEEEEPFSEIMIRQAIHTIEYVLSTISHTASYLRLWALSLAHAQLSEVLWSMVFKIGLGSKDFVGGLLIFFSFAAWAVGTLAILVMMEGLSAFLHTLRLHWVEFMSKFYAGLGYPFQPFCFKTILEREESAAEE